MEGPKEIVERLENDVNGILKYYDAAAKLYPYENLHGTPATNDVELRQQRQRFFDESPDQIIQHGSPYPLLFVYLMSRATATGPFDMRPLFKSPSRTVGWLLLGNSILMVWRMQYAA